MHTHRQTQSSFPFIMKAKHFKSMERDNVDMFNRLTNSLLVLIVGYLPFKEAVRTCILSKQWLHVWRETSNIEFNEKFFVSYDDNEENQIIQRNAFIDFTRRFIAYYPQMGIKRFALTCSKPEDFLSEMKNFVVFAISRNVKELELDFSKPTWKKDDNLDDSHQSVFELPLETYQLKGLESLKLFSCRFDAHEFTDLTCIRSFSLGWIELSIITIKYILVNSPLIETLNLKRCWDLEHFEIRLPNEKRLKKLIINRCSFKQDVLYIEGLKLEFLKYSGRIGYFHLVGQDYLVKVDLDYGLEPEFDEIGALLYYFLREFHAVKVLTVCSVLLQIIPIGDEPFGMETPLDVHHLILKTAMHFNEYYGISFMLRSLPRLEALTFNVGPAKIFPDYEPPFNYNPHEFWCKDLIVQRCLRRSLKVVNVKGFRGTLSELYVLRYIIHFGAKLREVNFYIVDGNGENKRSCIERIELLLKMSDPPHSLNVSVFS